MVNKVLVKMSQSNSNVPYYYTEVLITVDSFLQNPFTVLQDMYLHEQRMVILVQGDIENFSFIIKIYFPIHVELS